MKICWCIVALYLLLPTHSFAQTSEISPVSTTDLLPLLREAENQTLALSLLTQYPRSVTPLLWVRLITEASTLFSSGNNVRALFVLELARSVAERLEDTAFVGHTHYRIGYVHFAQGDTVAATDAFLLSKKTLEEAGARKDLVYVLSELGNLHIWNGDYERGQRYSEECLNLAATSKSYKPSVGGIPDDYGIARAWSNLGEVSVWEGNYDEALTRFQKSLMLWEGFF
jgi:tetratricopeptide (TPR) repeat protein